MSQAGGPDLARIALVIALVLFGAPLLTGALMMPMMGTGGTGVPMTTLLLALALPFVVVLLAVTVGLRVLSDRGTGDEALDELRMAYARGEVDDEEFERRRARLDED